MAAENTAPTIKNIVVLGGSYGGTSAAHYVLKHVIPQLPKPDSYKVILISASSEAFCRPSCPRAMISDSMFNQTKLFVSLTKQFEQYPSKTFQFIHGTATNVDDTTRTVTINLSTNTPQTLPFHALIIATGASTTSPLMGLNTNEATLKANWATFRKALPSAKTIIIAGGGPAGIETAGELGEYLNGRAGFFKSSLANPKVSITVLTSASKILPQLRESIATKAEGYLAQVGVTVLKNTKVVSVTPEGAGSDPSLIASKTTIHLENGKTLEADLYIPAIGYKPNTSFLPSSLLTPNGTISTSPSTLRVLSPSPRIYAVGDCSSAARPAVHLILEAIPVLCANVKRDLLLEAGKKEVGVDREWVEDKRETQMVPIGTKKGVGAAMGWSLPSWMVWAIKGRDYWLWTTGGLWSGKQWSKAS